MGNGTKLTRLRDTVHRRSCITLYGLSQLNKQPTGRFHHQPISSDLTVKVATTNGGSAHHVKIYVPLFLEPLPVAPRFDCMCPAAHEVHGAIVPIVMSRAT